MSGNPRDWLCYVVTDERLSRGRSHVELTRLALEGGADAIQYREKGGEPIERLRVACEMRELCRAAGSSFVVNDHVELAIECGADVLHVGQDDMPAEEARRRIPGGMRLGVSARTLDEALRAVDAGADHLGVGPIFDARASKSDAAEPLGLAGLARIRERVDLPLIAIGGIDHERAGEVMAAGADGLAVISCVVSAEDVALAARRLRAAVREAKSRG